MANSGPGWEAIEIAWNHLYGEREWRRRSRELGAEIVPPPDDVPHQPTTSAP